MEDRTQYGTKSCKLGRCTVNYIGDHATPGCGCDCHRIDEIDIRQQEINRLQEENKRLRECLQCVVDQCEEAHTALEMIGPHDGVELMNKIKKALGGK